MADNWFTQTFLEDSLHQFLDSPVTVLDYTGNALSGVSFASELFHTTVTYTTNKSTSPRKIALFIKRPPQATNTFNFIDQLNFFEKEMEMYQSTLPELNTILGSMGTLSPRCLYMQFEPIPKLVLEDISPIGFKMSDRRKGLDLEHCLCFAEKMALLHSASLVLHKRKPDSFKNYTKSLFWGTPLVTQWMKVAVETLIEACSNSSEYQVYASKLTRIKNEIPGMCSAASKTKPTDFCVLNHGDCWVNNFLFSYDGNGKVNDMRFIDYQLVCYGSPAIDLHYFWATSPNIETRRKHLHTFLDHYYDHLLINLEKLQHTPNNLPTREEFKKDWFSRAYYGFGAALLIMSLIKSDIREDAKLEYLFAPDMGFEGTFRHHVYNNSIAWEHYQYLLPFFDQLGIFSY